MFARPRDAPTGSRSITPTKRRQIGNSKTPKRSNKETSDQYLEYMEKLKILEEIRLKKLSILDQLSKQKEEKLARKNKSKLDERRAEKRADSVNRGRRERNSSLERFGREMKEAERLGILTQRDLNRQRDKTPVRRQEYVTDDMKTASKKNVKKVNFKENNFLGVSPSPPPSLSQSLKKPKSKKKSATKKDNRKKECCCKNHIQQVQQPHQSYCNHHNTSQFGLFNNHQQLLMPISQLQVVNSGQKLQSESEEESLSISDYSDELNKNNQRDQIYRETIKRIENLEKSEVSYRNSGSKIRKTKPLYHNRNTRDTGEQGKGELKPLSTAIIHKTDNNSYENKKLKNEILISKFKDSLNRAQSEYNFDNTHYTSPDTIREDVQDIIKAPEAFEINLNEIPKNPDFDFRDKSIYNLSDAFKRHKSGLIQKYNDQKAEDTIIRSKSKPKNLDKLELFRKKKETKNIRLSVLKKEETKNEKEVVKELKLPPPHIIDRLVNGERLSIGKEEMLKQTKRRYKNLPEIKKIENEKQRKEEARKRMARAREYSKVTIISLSIEDLFGNEK